MPNIIEVPGIIHFEPENRTKKHHMQSSWKKMAMVLISGDLSEYYAWFIKKRYGIELNKPLRGAHVSFISDSIKDMSQDGLKSNDEVETLWEAIKNEWNNQEVSIYLDINAKTDGKTWWLNIPEEERKSLQYIRNQLGLGRPFFGMHMSIGYANNKNIEQSEYIHRTIKFYDDCNLI